MIGRDAMRLGKLRNSELIDSIGYTGGPGTTSGTPHVKYAADGKVFAYHGVSYSTFRKHSAAIERHTHQVCIHVYAYRHESYALNLRGPSELQQ